MAEFTIFYIIVYGIVGAILVIILVGGWISDATRNMNLAPMLILPVMWISLKMMPNNIPVEAYPALDLLEKGFPVVMIICMLFAVWSRR